MNRVKRYIATFAQSEFSRNVLTVLGGTLVAQAIPVLISPFLTRWYSPADFGVFSLFTSMAGTLAVIATLRYEFAIMLPKRRYEAIQVLALSLLNALMITAIIWITLFLFKEPLLHWINADAVLSWVYLLPLYVFFAGCVQSFNYWFNRHKLYKYLSVVKASQSSVSAGVWVLFGLLNFGPLGLILGSVLAQVTGALTFGFGYIRNFSRDWKWINKRDIQRSYVRYKDFLIINSPHALLNTMQDLIVLILITQNYTSVVAGLYAFSYRILKLPVGLLGSSTYQVFLQKSNAVKDIPGRLHALVTNIIKRMALFGLVPFGILAIAGPQLFRFVFGEEWEQAGYIARCISPWLYLNFIGSTVSAIAMVRERQKTGFVFGVIDFTLQIATVYIAAKFDASLNVFIWMGAIGAAYQFAALYWFYKLSIDKPAE